MPTRTTSWLLTAILFGTGYALAGVVFAIPTTNVFAWRWAAWGASGMLLSMHTVHECLRKGNSPLNAAWHVAVGAAVGGFGIALGANVHSMLAATPSRNQTGLLLALGIWPIVTGLPAFVVSLAMSAVLSRKTT